MSFQPLPGFRDFFPEELCVRRAIQDVWRQSALCYGFEEVDGPPLEPLELYTKKSGDEIVGQLYHFVDKGDRQVAMRPEMTPTVARMVASRGPALKRPVRWFSMPQLFRYERPQKGRLREHFQFNCDLFGDDSTVADAELIALAIDVLRRFGLTAQHFYVRLSDRQLLAALLQEVGVAPDQLPTVYAVVDKLEKEPRASLAAKLKSAGLKEAVCNRIFAVLDAPFEEILSQHAHLPEISRLQEVARLLSQMDLGDFVKIDLSVVRGLAYYTGVVFELFDRHGEFRAIAGGGRYDHLLETLGGDPMPAIGFGMGDVVLTELLKAHGLTPAVPSAVDDFLVWVTPDDLPQVLRLAHRLRDKGRGAQYLFKHQGVGKQFKAAAQKGARRAIVVGPDERAQGLVVVKDLVSGTEEKVPIVQLESGPRL